MFHLNWIFDAMLPLEGERTDYRFAVIRGRKGKIGDEVGLRRTYTLLKKSPDEDQPVGAEAEPEKEPEELVEQPNEEAPTEAPEEVPTEEVIEETPEVPPSEEAPLVEEAPAKEEPPIAEEVVVEEVPEEVATEPEPEPEPEAAPEPEVVEDVAEEVVEEVVEPEPEVEAEPEPEEDIEEPLKMIFTPESPVYTEGTQVVKGVLHGFEKSDQLYITVEKSTSDENGWMGWAERDVRFRGERTPALTYTDC